jgi:glycosyltransferase involved in cell wall biosynthesis
MRVLLISDRGNNPGGNERYLADLAAQLRSEGDEVRVLAGVPAARPPSPPRGTLGSTGPPDVTVSDPPGPLRGLTQVINPWALAALRRELTGFAPDAVHGSLLLSHLSPAVLGLLDGMPTTVMVTDLRAACPKATKLLPGGAQCRRPAGRACVESGCLSTARAARDGIRQAVLRHGLSAVEATFGCSLHLAAELRGLGIDAAPLPLPVRAAEARREPNAKPTFVYAGRLAPVKGVDDLVDAFSTVAERHPAARLVIHGDGPDRDAAARRVGRRGLGGRVSMHPEMALDWTRSLTAATAMVAPSRYREPLGLSVIESILRGTPVIASREGGHSESIEEGTSGLLVDNGDVAGLAEAMASMCESRPPLPAVVPAPARARLAARHDPAAHVAALRACWTGAG